MENFFDLLDLETQNVTRACANEVTDLEINEFLQQSWENTHLLDFMFGGNEVPLYTVLKNTKSLSVMNERFNLRHLKKTSKVLKKRLNFVIVTSNQFIQNMSNL